MKYSTLQIMFINENRTLPLKELTQAFNAEFDLSVTTGSIKGVKARHGIKTGRDGRFKKGSRPVNKGCTGTQSPAAVATRFGKGHRPKNAAPVGELRQTTDGYWKLKVAKPNQWLFLHLIEWISYHGPVPEAHTIVFKNGDRNNCHISNLECISRKELVRRNKIRYSDAPDDLKPVLANVVKLQVAIAERKETVNSGVSQ